VQHWRLKAEELRTTAEMLTNAVARDPLEEMADGYDRLADKLEGLEATRRAKLKNSAGAGFS